ncbi:MAG: type II toxin-antitoxin system RelE/ParE family toxin [Candidatus Omnitrophica bacterium]|nr:type II toxin-antitoxin system RelE/ParE family toxin [Candidatus Omnitrophota bacterium]MCM8777324.1 type II toxin-antitoxin system RelE/ParE family toxin [Candidatus Omnitrophota bacterium]
MVYEIKWDRRAYKELKRIDRKIAIKILKKISRLSKNPQDYGTPLKGKFKNKYRVKIGDYRVIYWIEKDIVWIIAVGPRKGIYE